MAGNIEGYKRLNQDPRIVSGEVAITGTRVPVWIIGETNHMSGRGIRALREDYPHLSRAGIREALQYYYTHPEEMARVRRFQQVHLA
ncbi:DUF433 domain-containing protein [Candidatus Daviesbacteria bacterium]|nr:DUF433 domain-containing protein [Candidatus Daviesbacteria bacterium]